MIASFFQKTVDTYIKRKEAVCDVLAKKSNQLRKRVHAAYRQARRVAATGLEVSKGVGAVALTAAATPIIIPAALAVQGYRAGTSFCRRGQEQLSEGLRISQDVGALALTAVATPVIGIGALGVEACRAAPSLCRFGQERLSDVLGNVGTMALTIVSTPISLLSSLSVSATQRVSSFLLEEIVATASGNESRISNSAGAIVTVIDIGFSLATSPFWIYAAKRNEEEASFNTLERTVIHIKNDFTFLDERLSPYMKWSIFGLAALNAPISLPIAFSSAAIAGFAPTTLAAIAMGSPAAIPMAGVLAIERLVIPPIKEKINEQIETAIKVLNYIAFGSVLCFGLAAYAWAGAKISTVAFRIIGVATGILLLVSLQKRANMKEISKTVSEFTIQNLIDQKVKEALLVIRNYLPGSSQA